MLYFASIKKNRVMFFNILKTEFFVYGFLKLNFFLSQNSKSLALVKICLVFFFSYKRYEKNSGILSYRTCILYIF